MTRIKHRTSFADLADMQLLISEYIQGIWFLLKVIIYFVFRKYTWAVPFKDKKDITITNAFEKFQKRKPNKIWVDIGSEFYNR